MPRSSKSIVEQAIAEAGRLEYRKLTRGLSQDDKLEMVSTALSEFDKLRRDREIPDYGDPAVALLYSLWYLPSQVSLACSLVEQVLPFNNDVHIIDFGAGPGALALGAAIAVARRRGSKIEPRVTVHEVDCEAMRLLSEGIWGRYLEIAGTEGNRGCQRAARIIKKRTYANANDVVEAFNGDVPVETAKSLTALHVVYGDNKAVVKDALALLWDHAQPEWAVLTTPDVGAKLAMAREIAPFSAGRSAIPKPSLTGTCPQLIRLRQDIRRELPHEWPDGGLLWSDVTWEFEENRRPHVFAYPSAIGSPP